MKRDGIKQGKNTRIGDGSIVSPSVTLGDGVEIGNNAILEGVVSIGPKTRIDHGTIIRGNVRIGRNNWIYPYCTIGTGPQHTSHKEKSVKGSIKKNKTIEIGDNNTIREYGTIHLPVGDRTVIGSGCHILSYCHIAHDAVLRDGVTMSTQITLGGHVELMDYSTVGAGTDIHQYCRIGPYAMIGMGSAITKDVLPFALINRQEFTKVNGVGLLRNKIKKSDIRNIEATYAGNFPVKKPKLWYEKEISDFMKKSTRGVYLPAFHAKPTP